MNEERLLGVIETLTETVNQMKETIGGLEEKISTLENGKPAEEDTDGSEELLKTIKAIK